MDSGSGGKCQTMIQLYAFYMETLGLFQDGTDVYFMIRGHTGDDMDAQSGKVRFACHSGGANFASPADVFSHFRILYSNGGAPRTTVFCDFLHRDDWVDSGFHAKTATTADHFMYDWNAFFAPHAMRISGFCDKMVSRTEDSIHHWKLRMVNGKCELQVSWFLLTA